jgi:DNA repair protein RadD
MSVTLRPYQNEGVNAIRAAMRDHRKVLFVLPTGAGKTITFSHITHASQIKQKRILIVVHRAEIVRQISLTLTQFGIKHGLIQPGRTPTSDTVQVGMIQTVSRRLDKLPAPDMIVIDEAHHAITGGYVALIEKFPAAKVLGVTATPERLDGRGLRAQFDILTQGPTTRWLIESGFLADYDYYAPKVEIDLSGVKTRMGDYAAEALAEAVDKPRITGDVIKHYRAFLAGKSAIAFCVTVAHAEHVAADFRAAGIPAMSIDGSMSAGERQHRVEALKSGAIKILTSCDLISEGFDVPSIQGCIMLRPSKSMAMILQQWGRCLRLKPDGSRAIILDHVDNLGRFGTPKTDREWSLDSKKRNGESSGIKQCKSCFKAFEPGEMESYQCDESDDEDCLFSIKTRTRNAADAARELEIAAGELEAVSETPIWAGGIDILRASGSEYKALLDRADTMEKMRQIAKLRGYHHRWVHHAWAARGSNSNSRSVA